MVAMCCFGTPRSRSFSCVSVSAAEKAMARVRRMAGEFDHRGELRQSMDAARSLTIGVDDGDACAIWP